MLIHRVAHGELSTLHGLFTVSVFIDGKNEVTSLHTLLDNSQPLHLRIQSSCTTGHYFNSTECSCKKDVDDFQSFMANNTNSMLVLLDQEGKGNGNVAHIASQDLKKNEGLNQDEAYEKLGFSKDNRNYDIVAKILLSLGFKDCILHTQNIKKVDNLEKYNLNVKTY